MLLVSCDIHMQKNANTCYTHMQEIANTCMSNNFQLLCVSSPPLDFWKAVRQRLPTVSFATQGNAPPVNYLRQNLNLHEEVDFQSFAAASPCSLLISFFMCIRIHFVVTLKPLALFVRISGYSCFSKRGYLPCLGFTMQVIRFVAAPAFFRASSNCFSFAPHLETRLCDMLNTSATFCCGLSSSFNLLSSSMRRKLLTTRSLNFSLYTVVTGIPLFPWRPLPLPLVAGIDEEEEEAGTDEEEEQAGMDDGDEAGSDPRGHLGVTWGVYLCAGKPPLADIILSHPPDLTRCDSVIGLAIPAMSGHIQNRGAASGDLYIGI